MAKLEFLTKVALIDDEDLPLVSRYKWYFGPKQKYVSGRLIGGNYKEKFYLHKIVMDADKETIVDHINRDKADCRKCNLRIVTRWQNERDKSIPKHNTSGYKGVSWDSYRKKWRAMCYLNRKRIFLGWFDNSLDAAKAYNTYVLTNFGEFASPNDI